MGQTDSKLESLDNTLYIGCKEGYVDLVTKSLEKGADVNKLHYDKKGIWIDGHRYYYLTPLMIACYHGFIRTVNILINKGAQVNYSYSRYYVMDSVSAIKIACYSDPCIEIIKLLVNAGANTSGCEKYVSDKKEILTILIGDNKLIEEIDEKLDIEFKDGDDEKLKCKICFGNRVACMLDCKHVVVCFSCTKKLMNDKGSCPMCRKMITKPTKFFLA